MLKFWMPVVPVFALSVFIPTPSSADGLGAFPEIERVLTLQSQKAGYSVTAELERTISESSRTRATNEILKFKIDFFDWGYFAQKTKQQKAGNTGFELLKQTVALRSNDYSLDLVKSHSVKQARADSLSAHDGQASVFQGKRPSFVPVPMIPSAFKELISRLEQVYIVHTNDATGNMLIFVKGNDNAIGITQTWELLLSPQHMMAPVGARVMFNGKLMAQTKSDFGAKSDYSYFPSQFNVIVYNDAGKEIIDECYKGVQVISNLGEPHLVDDVLIPPGTLVNDYRFGDGFAYYMGPVPPSEGQLRVMSTNVEAISSYQKGGIVFSAPKYGVPTDKRRRMVLLGVFSFIGLLSGAFLYRSITRRSRRKC